MTVSYQQVLCVSKAQYIFHCAIEQGSGGPWESGNELS